MSGARTAYINRIKAIASSVNEPALADKAPTDPDHNQRALLLRNGVAIIGFASLELFIRARTAEVATSIARSGISFVDLPEGLRDACTFGALKGLIYQADLRRRQGEDVTPLIQDHTQKISTSSNPIFHVSEYSLGWDKPNLTHEEVKQMLGVFLVGDCWEQMRLFAARAGISVPSLLAAFRNSAARRHQAAHRGDAHVLLTDLQSFVNESIGIALGFDALISRAARLIINRDTAFLSNSKKLTQQDIGMRFVLMDGATSFRELEEKGSRAVRRKKTLQDALHHAEANARTHGQVVVVRDRRGIPESWLVTDV